MRKKVNIQMEESLEARPLAQLVQTANQYASRIYLEIEEKRVNAKSIMGVMSLAMAKGEEIILDVEGEDELEAMEALEAFLKK